MDRSIVLRIAGLGALIAATTFAAPPDLTALGKEQFDAQCAVCHSNGGGPVLKGVVGRKIAMTDFDYSSALRAKRSQIWDKANLLRFIEDPDGFAPGTAMSMAVPNANERSAIVAYLESHQ